MAPRALCIGINKYEGGYEKPLKGCESDAQAWKLALERRGFEVRPPLVDEKATRKAILDSLGKELQAARSGELVAMVFSGHGSSVVDTSGDESDHRDEALCPYDIKSKGPILDHDLARTIEQRPEGVRCLLIIDACHSGSVSRLVGLPPGAEEAPRVRFMPPSFFSASVAPRAAELPLRRLRAGALLLSACEDGELSLEGTFEGMVRGAFSYYALEALKSLPAEKTYLDWHRAIRQYLPSQKYRQTPDLLGTEQQMTRPVLT